MEYTTVKPESKPSWKIGIINSVSGESNLA
jgi:hypothetical protein